MASSFDNTVIVKKEVINEIKIEEFKDICNSILDIKQKNDIIYMIKQDIVDANDNISINELEFLSNNIFEYVCLLIKNIDKQEIVDYIIYKNNNFYDTLSDKEKENFTTSESLENFNEIISKYRKLIKKTSKKIIIKDSLRRVDNLGRVTIPSDMRERYGLQEKDPVEFILQDDGILLKKIHVKCIICGSNKKLINYKGKAFCDKCLGQLKTL